MDVCVCGVGVGGDGRGWVLLLFEERLPGWQCTPQAKLSIGIFLLCCHIVVIRGTTCSYRTNATSINIFALSGVKACLGLVQRVLSL